MPDNAMQALTLLLLSLAWIVKTPEWHLPKGGLMASRHSNLRPGSDKLSSQKVPVTGVASDKSYDLLLSKLQSLISWCTPVCLNRSGPFPMPKTFQSISRRVTWHHDTGCQWFKGLHVFNFLITRTASYGPINHIMWHLVYFTVIAYRIPGEIIR